MQRQMPWKPLRPPTAKELAKEKRGRGKKARFLIDKNVDREVADALRRLRWNVHHAEESELGTHEDEDIYAFARSERRVLLTHDLDFLDDRRFPLRLSPGVIVLPGGSGERGAMIRGAGLASCDRGTRFGAVDRHESEDHRGRRLDSSDVRRRHRAN